MVTVPKVTTSPSSVDTGDALGNTQVTSRMATMMTTTAVTATTGRRATNFTSAMPLAHKNAQSGLTFGLASIKSPSKPYFRKPSSARSKTPATTAHQAATLKVARAAPATNALAPIMHTSQSPIM